MNKDNNYIIRKSTINDIDQIMNIYEIARNFMIKNNNPSQWGLNYPSKDLILEDINKSISYVICKDNKICGTFMFIIGEDPTYNQINGSWLDNSLYGTIHRIASDGISHKIFEAALNYCLTKINHIRIDTHLDNKIMQKKILENKFKKCGIISINRINDNIENIDKFHKLNDRIAYERIDK
jgi:hypothetical protein